MTRWIRHGAILLGSIAVEFAPLGSVSFGQTTSGSIIGQVRDPADAVVPGVSVTVTNEASGERYTKAIDHLRMVMRPRNPGVAEFATWMGLRANRIVPTRLGS